MKTNVKTMQDLAATFPDIYREHKLLCHAQKKAGSVVITVIDEHNNSFLFFRCKLLPISNLKNGNEKKQKNMQKNEDFT